MNAIFLILIIAAFGLTIWAQFRVKGTFNKYAEVPNMRGMSGYDAARHMLDSNGLHDVPIEPIAGVLTDHYDPVNRVVRLSEPVYYGTSISAVSVACHEIGHAIQHKVHYPMLAIRHRIFPVVNFASGIAPLLLLAGFVFQSFNLIGIGVLFFSVAVAFQLITLPVEFNASNRARDVMVAEGYVTHEEERSVGKVLNAAALTYVAAALLSVLELARYLFLLFGNRD
ncbi:zinc metallopeptidase [Paenibacillus hunanensis]|uniref:Zn-dependent membrane protease YugP n=1 Tax=Paenibacillus hunanensis TaxID=539262 RepID=A0ABU1J3T6_9BACL|nr:zinc metallopeptidase [Paenibacillus hunanensis]MDR6245232.1 Zn-dependent membrane protease YugP [Paenibacillus hunanensis]GGJ20350.1 putative membrane protease YugP [Paenibacillus hunanensis]